MQIEKLTMLVTTKKNKLYDKTRQ